MWCFWLLGCLCVVFRGNRGHAASEAFPPRDHSKHAETHTSEGRTSGVHVWLC